MNVDRARVLAIIRGIRDEVAADRGIGTLLTEDPQVREIVRRACAEHRMSVDDWISALRADLDLARFFEQLLDELVVDPPDPGPYDMISRESPDGTLEDELALGERMARPRVRTHR